MSLVHSLPKNIIGSIENGRSPFYIECADNTSITVYITSGRYYLYVVFSINSEKKISGVLNATDSDSYYGYLYDNMKLEIDELEKNMNDGKYSVKTSI
jgi:hypothetical protein